MGENAEMPDFLVDRSLRDVITVRCSGRITSAITPSLKETVKPLFSKNKTVVLDLMEWRD